MAEPRDPGPLPDRTRRPRLAAIAAAQLVSVLGENVLLATALPLYALDATGSARSVGVALAAVTAAALFSLPCGAWASRHPARRTLLSFGLLRLLPAAALVAFRAPAFSVVLAAVFAISLADSFFMPALKGALPAWVAAADLARANALLEATDIPAQWVGPLIAVALYERWGIRAAAGAQVACYAVAWTLLGSARMPRSDATAARPGEPFWPRVRFTLAACWAAPLVRATLLAWSAGMAAAGIVEALVLPFIRMSLHQPDSTFGLFGALLGAGMALGAATAARFEGEISTIAALAGAGVWVTTALAVFAAASTVGACGAALAAAGAGMVWVHVSADTLLQTKLHEDARSGALGLTHTIQAVGLLIGMALGGLGAAPELVRPTLWVAVMLLACASLVAGGAALAERIG